MFASIRPRLLVAAWALLLSALVVLVGCGGPDDEIVIDAFELDGERLELPFRLGNDRLVEGETYRLRQRVALPERLRGVALDLHIPVLQAQVTTFADGVLLVPARRSSGYRVAEPQSWRIPAEVTVDGYVELELAVEHRWTMSGWLTTKPRLVAAGTPEPVSRAVELVNLYCGWLAMGALIQVGLTCLLVSFLDRRRRAYMWFGIQTVSASVYPAFLAGLTIPVFGTWDVVMAELGLVIALMASLEFSHRYYDLGPTPRWLLGILGLAGVLSLVVFDPYQATGVSVRAVVASVVLAIVYQLFVLGRLWWREPSKRVSVGLLIGAWLALAFGTWADLLAWFAVTEPLGGARPASIGLTLFALFLALLFSRSHIRSMAEADRYNAELQAKVTELEAEKGRVVSLNLDLRTQIADRSAQLFSALALISAGERQRATLTIGSEVDGRYRIERILGSGAMGMVYEVSRLDDKSRWAMKVATGVAGQDLARLAREAHIASKLAHVNVVAIRDIDIATRGFLYIVLELVEGESLRRRLERGPLAPERAIEVLAQVARGLAALHEAGVAHRDLKPDNVLVSGPEHALAVKIADFGISRLGEGASGGSTGVGQVALAGDGGPSSTSEPAEVPDFHDEATVIEPVDASPRSQAGSGPSSGLDLTGTGMLAGTPHYVAPELARGGSPTDVRADLFSFGVLAYELVTGKRPFAIAAAISIRAGEEPVSQRPLELGPEHAELTGLVLACLSFDVDARPSAAEAATTLAQLAAPA